MMREYRSTLVSELPTMKIRTATGVAVVLGLLSGGAFCGYRSFFPANLVVPAVVETESVSNAGDAADDPAIWIDPKDPARSVVIGTDKRGGISVYDLTGRQLQVVIGDEVNNVDLRNDFPLGDTTVSIVAGGDGRREQIVLWRIDPAARELVEVPNARINLSLDPEGLTMYRSPLDGRFYVFVVGRDYESGDKGWLEQWEIRPGVTFPIDAERVRRTRVGGESEGMVADDRTGELYVSEEQVGIWRYSAEPNGGEERTLIDRVGWRDRLKYNVEGLAIHTDREGVRHLVASSQGSNDFVVYRLAAKGEPAVYVGRFAVEASAATDGVSHTDGIDVTGANLGPNFPDGLFVCQDDRQSNEHQNFKLVSWAEVADRFRLVAVGD